MSIFDIFTGAPARDAARDTRNYLTGVQNDLNPRIDAAVDRGLGFLQGGYGDALNRVDTAGGVARGDITGGVNLARDALNAGTTAATDAFAPLTTLAGNYGAGANAYYDALGLNGPEGVARARGMFQAGPGYQWQVDQGLDAINRSRNARGMLNSGNTDIDALRYGQGLANQEWGAHLGRLGGFLPLELQATGAAAEGLAGIGERGGRSLAALEQGGGQSLADIASRTGMYGAGLAAQGGQGAADIVNQGIGNRLGLQRTITEPYARTFGEEAAAEMRGSGNLWGLGLSLAGMAAGIPGLGSSLGNINAMGSPSSLTNFARNGPAGSFSMFG